jgi:hypothetical protein
MVSSESVDKTCSEVGEYTDERMVDEFDRFFRVQPAVCEFIIELTQESDKKIQELSLFLSYIVFKAIDTERPGTAATIEQADIETAYQSTESWMARLSQAENTELQATIAASLTQDKEPFLLQYVISELNEPMEDGTELNDEEKGEIFFILKTVISAIEQEPKRRTIEID